MSRSNANINPTTTVTISSERTTPQKPAMPSVETLSAPRDPALHDQSPLTVPVISRTSPMPDSTPTSHGHLPSVHLPLSAATSLGNGATNRTTPTMRAEKQPKKTTGPKGTPKRNFKGNQKGKRQQQQQQRVLSVLNRPCEHHSFLTEVTDVQQMEQGLVQLLDDFHSGKLQAFGKDCSFQRMDNVREQQERLARLHFDLGSQQENYGSLSEEGRTIAKDHLTKLMAQLQDLSLAIEQLQSSTSGSSFQTEV